MSPLTVLVNFTCLPLCGVFISVRNGISQSTSLARNRWILRELTLNSHNLLAMHLQAGNTTNDSATEELSHTKRHTKSERLFKLLIYNTYTID